jgi:hypothetical protein
MFETVSANSAMAVPSPARDMMADVWFVVAHFSTDSPQILQKKEWSGISDPQVLQSSI